MTALCFVDTNILVYARDASEPDKQPRAHDVLVELWRTRCGRVSAQVLSEYYVTVTRKLNPGLSPDAAWRDLEDLLAWRPVPTDAQLLRTSRSVSQQFGFSWWDAMIVAAAQQSGCTYLLTEDLQDGQTLDKVQVVNPLLAESLPWFDV